MKRLLLPALILFSGCSIDKTEKEKTSAVIKNHVDEKKIKKVTSSATTLEERIQKVESPDTYQYEKTHHISAIQKLAVDDPNAMFYIAALYEEGDLLPLSPEKARELYKKAADKGHTLSRYYLALMLIDGKGGEKNHSEAERLLLINHEKSHAPSSYSLAYLYFIHDDYENAAKLMESDKVEMNENNAYLLAISYLQLNKNTDKAVTLLHSSASKNHKYSHQTLGKIYRHGIHNTEQDLEKSYFHYTAAAKDNDPKVLYEIATLSFKYPFLIDNNYDIPLKQLTLAAKSDYEPATFQLAKLYDQGYQIKQDYQQAFYWYKKSAESGNNKAMYNLASMYANGDGVEESYEQAEFWLEESANHGNKRAIELLSQE
ncbi:SEL1-like repeat protein [Photobacterium leiognathi]|uniref:SEL1-like repeat protein n=1 Tax=Photobacterium leiognathi TaxID=553611 RepID=UPI0029829FAA|nr:SEL1-like repeat protein [Photobacterium leiognathi]